MFLELQIIEPRKISVIDNELIGLTHHAMGPPKTEFYDEFEESSYHIDVDELSKFADYTNAIYENFGWNLKAVIVHSVKIPCDDDVIFDDDTTPSIIMNPMCQRFADQLYSCEQFFWTADEFKVFFDRMLRQMKENGITDPAVDAVQNEILPKLRKGGRFIYFAFC